MPISPYEVLPFVLATDIGDRVITAIDNALKSTEEQHYRKSVEDGPFLFHFKVRYILNKDDVRIISESYSKVGWKFCLVNASEADYATYITLVPPDFFGGINDVMRYANDHGRFKLLATGWDV